MQGIFCKVQRQTPLGNVPYCLVFLPAIRIQYLLDSIFPWLEWYSVKLIKSTNTGVFVGLYAPVGGYAVNGITLQEQVVAFVRKEQVLLPLPLSATRSDHLQTLECFVDVRSDALAYIDAKTTHV